MPRPRSSPHLEVRETFEPTRLSPQCLVAAYSQVVPVPRRTIAKMAAQTGPPPSPPVNRLRSSGGEHA